jgi:hypothetical protein
MELIPTEEKSKWTTELRPILTEMNKLSDADKIQGFKNEVIDKYVAHKALNYVTQQLILVDCDREMLEKENEALKYKVDNLGNYDENRMKEFRNKTVVVPSTDNELRDRAKKIFMRNQTRMKLLNGNINMQINE